MSNRRRDSRSQRWSACSLRQLRYFLTSGRGSCLANYPAPSAITLPGRRALPGQAISLDTQCFKVASREKSFTTMFRYFLSSPDISRVPKFTRIFIHFPHIQKCSSYCQFTYFLPSRDDAHSAAAGPGHARLFPRRARVHAAVLLQPGLHGLRGLQTRRGGVRVRRRRRVSRGQLCLHLHTYTCDHHTCLHHTCVQTTCLHNT